MAEVTLTINGKNYGISCDDGQEQRVIDLAHYVDSKVQDMFKAGAATTENHALVLAALIIADESFDLMENTTSAKSRGAQVESSADPASTQGMGQEQEAQIANAIEQLAGRIDAVADRMKAA